MANLHCECQELKPKGETNSSVLVLHPSSGEHTVKTVGSHLYNYFSCCRLAFKTWENTVSDITSVTNLDANFHPESFVLLCHTPYGPDTSALIQVILVQNLKMTNFPKGGNVHAGKKVCCGTFNMLVAGLTL